MDYQAIPCGLSDGNVHAQIKSRRCRWGRQPLAIDHCLFVCLFVFCLCGTSEDKTNSGRVLRYGRFPEGHSKWSSGSDEPGPLLNPGGPMR